ncbi:hypothetical protein C1708_15990 [Streptomyces sp. DH-12]|uniref:hypothetical protein n=1 Tax=unclassified Streptomyces TaxID=2593676 RepID=UPI000CCE6EAD|nr:hypothetical protein [Streptomyces sp. DH-12]PNV33654.1 hypothetical protein C1708_15990 [Streptomyces sp. DH-12]
MTTGDSWRERRRALLRDDPAAAEAAERLLEDMGTEERDDEEVEAGHRAGRLAAVRAFEPDARLDEELRLRLTGPDTEGGALRFQWGDALLNPVENALSVAAGTPIQLELTGISAGSTVVHARPVPSVVVPETTAMDAPATSAASTGMQMLTRLLGALEAEQDVREWSRLFDAVDALARALGKYELDLGVTWYGADGDMRRAQLTERGRRHVERLREKTRARDQELIISGRVTELRESGWVKVKTGTARNAQAYDVHFEEPETLLRMRPGLGDNVHFRVRFRQRLDAVGIARSTEYTYLGPAAEQSSLPLEP